MRTQEREAFIAEIVAERRRLAEETAVAARAAEEARANLLDLKSRVAQYEAQAAAALRQAHDEQAKAEAARESGAKERASLDELRRELQVWRTMWVGHMYNCSSGWIMFRSTSTSSHPRITHFSWCMHHADASTYLTLFCRWLLCRVCVCVPA